MVLRIFRITYSPTIGRQIRYFRSCAGGNSERALRLYAWNIEISSAFWGSFHMLEISLRNALHSELAKLANQEDWWNVDLPLHIEIRKEVRRAVAFAMKRHKELPTTGHVVAELNLAFPHYTGRRGALHDDLERLRMLRNRIAHHEPIFDRNLALDHDKLCGLIGYIEPEAMSWVIDN
jgi:hypothetical protein